MKQALQYLNTGILTVTDVPSPLVRSGHVLVRTGASLVSAGTERMVVNFAEKNLLQKARSRPDLVKQTLDKANREGLLTTLDAVRNRLDQPMALGYSSAGTVVDVGAGVPGIQIGDRVACAGGGYASHAEIVTIPKNLVVRLGDKVTFEVAAFTTLGAIALQGIRLAEVKLGELSAVIGLGLLGQLTVQMLKAAGCFVIGFDLQRQRADLALQSGADVVTTDPVIFADVCRQYSDGHGADAVLITADTKSNQPLEVAGEIARDKGIVVAVGAVGMTIPRKPYYEKELDFRVSRSYGPGRYDSTYEEKGQDYPYGYVRWTQQRNMQAFAQLIAEGKVNVESLITHRFAIEDAPKAYEVITGKTAEPFLGVVLTYPKEETFRNGTTNLSSTVILHPAAARNPSSTIRLGVLGAGNFANATLLPAIKKVAGVEFAGIVSSGGVSARTTGDRFGFGYCSTDEAKVLQDTNINLIAILTQHNQHARQVIASLNAGKQVFVEKPLCLNEKELDDIVRTYNDKASKAAPLLMVGFNRRFAPFVLELKQHLLRLQEPVMLNYRVNAGYIPPDHWTQDVTRGGGRLLGEGCHFIDLLIYLSGSKVRRVTTHALPDVGRYANDNLLITLEMVNGSVGTVTYVANGDKGFGKEFIEVFGGGLSARLEDFRTLSIYHGKDRIKKVERLRQDKGHRGEWQAIADYLQGKGEIPISFPQVVHSTEVTLAAHNSLREGTPCSL